MKRKQVIAALIDAMEVEDRDVARFTARVEQIQKLGFLPSSNCGRADQHNYTTRDLCELMIILDLLNVGLSPQAIKYHCGEGRVIHDEKWEEIYTGLQTTAFMTMESTSGFYPINAAKINYWPVIPMPSVLGKLVLVVDVGHRVKSAMLAVLRANDGQGE